MISDVFIQRGVLNSSGSSNWFAAVDCGNVLHSGDMEALRTVRMENTSRFGKIYQGCRVPGCDRPHRSKGFCRGHLSAFERGRLDSSGSPILNQCELCPARYVARRADRRFCAECVLRRARERAQRRRNGLRAVRASSGVRFVGRSASPILASSLTACAAHYLQ